MSKPIVLGRLTRNKNLREVWEREDTEFTPWLAKPENLELLAMALGIDQLTLEAIEHGIGRFSADIVARDGNGLVLTENQIEPTDHRHLGQILTYLAGLEDATTVVWIAQSVLQEHRAAIDWLNANTSDRFSFFGVEIELLQIDQSPLAPDFKIVAQPNDWSRSVGSRIRGIESATANPLRQLYFDYWTGFHDYLVRDEGMARAPKPSTQQWMGFGIGRAKFALYATFQREQKWIRVDLWMADPKKIAFRKLEAKKEEIEKEIGVPLSWEEMPGKRTSRIAVYRYGVDVSDRDTWPSQFHWYAEQIKAFRRLFVPRVRELDLDDDEDMSAPEPDTE